MNSRPSLPLATIVAAIAVVLAACGSTADPTGSLRPGTPSPTAVAQGPTPAPTSPARPATPPAEPTANPQPTSRPTPQPAFSPRETALVDLLRPDVRTDCAPRRAGLPDGASHGVECRLSGGPAARVGVYAFATDHDAAAAYFARLAEHGVKPLTGDCGSGAAGDNAWMPGDLEPELEGDAGAVVVDGKAYMAQRNGCYLDGGTANVRVTCDGGIYIGILGRSDDIAELFDWTWTHAPGVEPSVPGAPGICHYLQG